MPWKMDGDSIVVDNGNPVWIYPDKKETGLDAQKVLTNLGVAQNEAKTRKEMISTLEAQLVPIKDIDDIAAFMTLANSSIATVKGLDDKQLIDAGEVTKVTQQYVDQIAATKLTHETAMSVEKTISSGHEAQVKNLLFANAFNGSKFISDKTSEAFTPDVALALFGSRMDVEEINGQKTIVGLMADGKTKLVSLSSPGSNADSEEVIEQLINEHKDRNLWLKGIDGGGGAQGGGHSSNGKKTVSRSEFDKWTPTDQSNFVVTDGGTVID